MSELLEKWAITEERVARALAWLEGLRLGTKFALCEIQRETDRLGSVIWQNVRKCEQFSASGLGAIAGCQSWPPATWNCRMCVHQQAATGAGRAADQLRRIYEQLRLRLVGIDANVSTLSGNGLFSHTHSYVESCLRHREQEMERPGLVR